MSDYFDIAVIIPLEEELDQFIGEFEPLKDLSTSTEFRHSFRIANSSISVLAVQQDDMGKSNAYKAASRILDDFQVGLFVCLGIAGSLSKDMSLGDVCYTGSVIDVYDNTKAIDIDNGGIDIEFSPSRYVTKREIAAACGFIRTIPKLKPIYQAWQQDRVRIATELRGLYLLQTHT